MGDLVHLAFTSPHVEDDKLQMLACRYCRNKTYTLTYDRIEDFPLMRCAACGQHLGRMGWSHDDDEDPPSEQMKPDGSPPEIT